MPSSTTEGKDDAVEMLDYLGVFCGVKTILDVGAGMGTWYDKLHPIIPKTKWHAIEVWDHWVERFALQAKYDKVFQCNALTMPLEWLLPSYDLTIYGDILEHLAYEDAVTMVKRLPGVVGLLSIPMIGGIHEHQEAFGGSEYERHRSFWTPQLVNETFTVAAQKTTSNIGVFIVDLHGSL
jgi:hypothetical protein